MKLIGFGEEGDVEPEMTWANERLANANGEFRDDDVSFQKEMVAQWTKGKSADTFAAMGQQTGIWVAMGINTPCDFKTAEFVEYQIGGLGKLGNVWKRFFKQ